MIFEILLIRYFHIYIICQIYICVRLDIFLPRDSIVKTLFIAFFNGIFYALDLSLSTNCSYSFANPKQVLFRVFVYFCFLCEKSYFSFFSSFFYWIDWYILVAIVLAILKFVVVSL